MEPQPECEAAAALERVLELERRNVASTGPLRTALDAKYVAVRKDLTNVVGNVALFYEAGWAAAHLCMALLDAYRVRSMQAAAASSVGAQGMELELAALGLLGVAVGLVRDPSCGERPHERSLMLLVQRWRLQVQRLRPQTLAVRPEFLDEFPPMLVRSVRGAQLQMMATLEWRLSALSVATADAVLDAMLAAAGAAEAKVDWAEVAADARAFCQLGLLRGFSWFYGQAALAAACVQAARRLAGVEPAWPAALARCSPKARAGLEALEADEVELCVRDLLHAHHEQRPETPRTPSATPSAAS
jgi:hypothetical protein